MIIWLASYPRSGNTFFRMLLYYTYGIKTYSIYNDPLFEEIGAADTVGHELLPKSLDDLASDHKVYFVKTHDLPSDESPSIYIVRDGRDALVSYARYILSFSNRLGMLARLRKFFLYKSFRRVLRDLIISNQHYGGWTNNVIKWTFQRKNGITFPIRYEDLLNQPYQWLNEALEVLQVQVEPLGEFELPDFASLHAKWPQFFRKGKIGSWREEMPKYLHDLFWKYHREAMVAFGYE